MENQLEQTNKSDKILFFLLCLYSVLVFMFNGQEDNIIYIHIIYALLAVHLLLQNRHGFLFGNELSLMFAYLVFGFVSLIWSPDSELTISRCKAYLLLWGLCLLINNNKSESKLSEYLIKALIIGGLFETGYCIYLYGFSDIVGLVSQGTRLENILINNVNALANTLVFCIIATFSCALFQRKFLLFLFLIPEMYILFAFQSRTSFIALITGVMVILFFYSKGFDTTNRQKRVIRILFIITLIVLVLLAVDSSLGIFDRFEDLFGFFKTGSEGKAASLSTRSLYIQLGFEEFLHYPILGRGFGCAGQIIKEYIGRSTYLHNNFIEILASGGIVGFLLYYGVYFSLFKKLKRKVKFEPSPFTIIAFSLLCSELISHIGIVTYYSKVNFFVLTFCIFEANKAHGTEQDFIY